MRAILPILVLAACNADPGEASGQVGYRPQIDDGPSSGERGNVIISEILWSGSVRADGEGFRWDPDDVFIEIRNQGSLPVDVEDWLIVVEGAVYQELRLPDIGARLEVGQQVFFAKKSTGCFPEADGYLDDLEFPSPGDPIELTLLDADERLIEPAGSETMPPYAGGYDLVASRSMERTHLMFADGGNSPHVWHHYTNNQAVDVPNNDRIDPTCTARTLASPGRANSPDYSGATASGGFE